MNPPFVSTPELLPHCSSKGFSLMELLVVLGILGVVVVLAVPATGDLLRERALGSAVDRTWDAMAAARAEAVAGGSNVAFVLTSGRAEDLDGREAIMLLRLQRNLGDGQNWGWEQASNWRLLPSGIRVAPIHPGSFLSSNGSTVQIPAFGMIADALPPLNGMQVEDFVFLVFRPDGSVESGSAEPAIGFGLVRDSGEASAMALLLNPELGRARVVDL